MTKGEYVDSVLLKVNAGIPSSETRVMRSDIEFVFAPAMNWALTKLYYIAKDVENISEFPDDMIFPYYVDVLFDAEAGLRYINLPAELVTLTRNRGLAFVGSIEKRDFVQTRRAARQHDEYYEGNMSNQVRYELLGQKIYFRNMPKSVSQVVVGMLVSFNSLGENDQMPLPAESQMEVLNLVVKYFLETKMGIADTVVNNNN